MITNFTEYRIYPTEGLIVDYLAGEIQLSDLLSMKEKQINDISFDPQFAFIVDIRDAVIKLTDEDLNTYLEFLKVTPNLIANRRAAYLTETAEQVTTTSIYMLRGNGLPMRTEIVSSLSAAFRWTGANMNLIDEVSMTLNSLHENFLKHKFA